MPRMIILHAAERQAYEAPPILDVPERSRAFDVPAGLLAMAKALRKPAHRIGFLVSCAYFGVAKRFFAPKDYHARDIRHAAHQLELPATFAAADYPARARQRYERLILQFHGYRRFDGRAEDFLAREVAIMAEAHLKPKLIFWRCLDLMARERVQLPGEHRLTALIAAALQRRKRQLAGRLEQLMTVELRDRLDDLFVQATPAADGTASDKVVGIGSGLRWPPVTRPGMGSGRAWRVRLRPRSAAASARPWPRPACSGAGAATRRSARAARPRSGG
jgi:hypothetical protein